MTFPTLRPISLLRLAWIPFVAALVVVPACGDSSSDSGKGATGGTGSGTGGAASGGTKNGTGGTKLDSGVDDSKGVTDLTPDELEQLCDATAEAVEQTFSKERVCQLGAVMAGLSASDPETTCKAAEQECLAEPTETDEECNVPAECDITVGEYEACLNDSFGLYGTVAGTMPDCDGLTQDGVAGWVLGLALIQQPASCTVVEEKCPDAIPDLGDVPGGLGGGPGFGGAPNF